MFNSREKKEVALNVISSQKESLRLSMQNAPRKLCEELINEIIAIKVMHESAQFERHSDYMLRALYEMERACNQFYLNLQNNELDCFQNKYIELCGMVVKQVDLLKSHRDATQCEKNLVIMLNDMLRLKGISENQALHTNKNRTGKTCVEYYSSLNPIRTSSDYIRALHHLKETLRRPQISDDLNQHGKSLIEQIELVKNESPNHMNYAVKILNQTNELMKCPAVCGPDYAMYLALAKEAPGKSSTWKKVIGAMFMVASVLVFLGLVGLSIFASVTTAGAAAPLAILGLGAAASAWSALGAAAGFIVGMCAYAEGKSTGLSRSMESCHDALQKRQPNAPCMLDQKHHGSTPSDGKPKPVPLSELSRAVLAHAKKTVSSAGSSQQVVTGSQVSSSGSLSRISALRQAPVPPAAKASSSVNVSLASSPSSFLSQARGKSVVTVSSPLSPVAEAGRPVPASQPPVLVLK